MEERAKHFTEESDEGWRASVRLEWYYVGSRSQVLVDKPIEQLEIDDERAVEILLNLAAGIVDKTVKSHTEVACVLRSLRAKLTRDGGSSDEINKAALIVDIAISDFAAFGSPDPKGWTFRPIVWVR